jgi:hypothetical protein
MAEVKQVRIDEIKLIKIDEPAANIRYIGRSSSMRGTEDQPIWQIMRQYRNGDIITSNYAIMGEYKCKWTERESYFTPPAIPDDDNPLDGNIAVTGTFTPSGLRIAGRVTEVLLSTTEWTALPPGGPLADRNAINIQNYSGDEIRLNYSNTIPGFTGIILNDQSERAIDVKDTIQIYAKARIGGSVIIVDEIS